MYVTSPASTDERSAVLVLLPKCSHSAVVRTLLLISAVLLLS
jgi:hypothetical protein